MPSVYVRYWSHDGSRQRLPTWKNNLATVPTYLTRKRKPMSAIRHSTYNFTVPCWVKFGLWNAMPKRYYCDYCDMYLTKGSYGARNEHKCGHKHRDNVIAWYSKHVSGFMNSPEGVAWQAWYSAQMSGQEFQFPPVPEGWTVKHDACQQGRPYFIHIETGQTQWHHPSLGWNACFGKNRWVHERYEGLAKPILVSWRALLDWYDMRNILRKLW